MFFHHFLLYFHAGTAALYPKVMEEERPDNTFLTLGVPEQGTGRCFPRDHGRGTSWYHGDENYVSMYDVHIETCRYMMIYAYFIVHGCSYEQTS